MKITIEFSKRNEWRMRKAWRWICRNVPDAMEIIGMAMMITGGLALFGEGGNYECGELVHVSVVVAAILAMVIGFALLWAVREIDEAMAKKIEERKKRMKKQQA